MPRWAALLVAARAMVVAFLAAGLGTGACVDLSRPPLAPRDAAADRPVMPDLPIDRGPDTDDGAPDGDADVDAGDVGPPDGDAGGLATGSGCAAHGECASGLCVDEVCCDGACVGPCLACNVAGKEGTCAPIAAGEDPAMECAMDDPTTCGRDGTCDGAGACRKYQVGTQCGAGSCSDGMETPASTCDATGACQPGTPRACPGVCQGSTCGGLCTSDSSCPAGAFCDVDTCRSKRSNGSACTKAVQCQSNHCVDNTCCASACTELCSACNTASAPGTCTPIAAGQDPQNECALQLGNPCGYDGTCNGAGACRRPVAGTSCGMSSCSSAVETPAPTCNGAGTCNSLAPRDCGAYVCAGNRCGTSCASESDCNVGHTCAGTTCVPLPGPVLYWKLDESSGTTAFDATSNGNHGTYTGSFGTPTSSMVLPPAITFPNAASRFFDRDARHAIRLSDVPAALKPTGDLTLATWFKANDTDSSGESELISGGNNYNLRIFDDQLEIAKHTSTGHKQCRFSPANPADGNWHHLAGVITTTQMRLYYDGNLIATCPLATPIVYLSSTVDLWIARHGGNTSDVRDFEGHLDDIRIYNRALSMAEIARLAMGKP